jgi:hypothetical protein
LACFGAVRFWISLHWSLNSTRGAINLTFFGGFRAPNSFHTDWLFCGTDTTGADLRCQNYLSKRKMLLKVYGAGAAQSRTKAATAIAVGAAQWMLCETIREVMLARV